MQSIDLGERIFAGFLQQLRNVIITSAMSVTLLAFNRNSVIINPVVNIIALLIILYSIFYGLNSIKNFKQSISVITKNNQPNEYQLLQIRHWKDEIKFFYIYLFILVTIVIIIHIVPFLRNLF